MRLWLLAAGMGVLWSVSAQAQMFVPLRVDQSMTGWLSFDNGSGPLLESNNSASNEVIGPWQHTLVLPHPDDAAAEPDGWPPAETVSATASQYTDAADNGLFIHGWVDYACSGEGEQWPAFANAELTSVYGARFLLTEPAIIQFSGNVSAYARVDAEMPIAALETDAHLFTTAAIALRKVTGDELFTEQVEAWIDMYSSEEEEAYDDRVIATAIELSPGVYDLDFSAYLNIETFKFTENLIELVHILRVDFIQQESPESCLLTDADDDGDIDLRDFQIYQLCFTGPID